MRLIVDTHTHTVSSGHAYSTVQEMVAEARKNGIEMFAITDHGPGMKGAPFEYHFTNLRIIPREINGVRIIKGAEVNIINYKGDLDLSERCLKRLEFVIASLHDVVIEPSTVQEHTNALIGALKNPLVDAIGHPGNPVFNVDIEKVVLAAKEYGKFIEINSSSIYSRKGSEKNCAEFIKLCKLHKVKIVCGSDAHISFDVGNFKWAYELIENIKMPEELIMNTEASKLMNYIEERKDRIKNLSDSYR